MENETVTQVWERGDQPPLLVSFELSEVEGYPMCVGVSVRASDVPCAVNSTVLRSMPFGALLQSATQERFEKIRPGRARPGREERVSLERVANLYAASCRAHSRHPRLDVAKELRLPNDTVAKQIQRCRKAGLLAPTKRGRAGGLITKLKTEAAGASLSAGGARLDHERRTQHEEGSEP